MYADIPQHPKKMILFFSHTLTPEQVADAKESLGVETIIPLDEETQKVWSNVPPDSHLEFFEYLEMAKSFLIAKAERGDCVLVQGDYGATYHIVRFCEWMGFLPFYSTTERQSVETVQPDGSVVTQRVFKHKAFRRYRYDDVVRL